MSLYSRFLTFSVVFPFLLIYSYYISEEKYDGKYIYLFILFCISSLLSGLNESFRLLTLAFNKYAIASFIDTISSTLAKCVGIFLMVSYGIKVYILSIIIFSVFSLICYIIVNKEWIINPFCFSFRALRGELKELKTFTYSGYLRFINSTLDQLIVSIVLSPSILSTYSLSRNVLAIADTTMSNLIDYKVQKLVKYKNNRLSLIKGIHQLVDFQKLLSLTAVISLVLVIVFIIFINKSGFLILNIKYPYFYFSFIFVCIGSFIIVNYKLYQSFAGMFISSTLLLKLDIQRGLLYLLSFLSITFFLQERWIFLYIAFYNAIDFIIYKKYFIMGIK
ncbi:hypothetical protein [Bacteroidetes bacterium endosymbiont of Geopemphigus sp.]|uniref:hypothetical protein n=1 Tax=Bacteroidetes bacterium endosymbiont of Geopemphigus sp. TaxID=2047937 RepID=UPI0011AEE0DD|nr:hypothetical protein [Bacteroidetes bacterium endosymbiont of Geopemphigus sp.]